MSTLRRIRHPKTKHGFSLIEMMVAMVAGLILIGGVFQIYLNTKNTYRMQEALGRVQETGRFALDMLNRDIRQADFWGCLASLEGGSIVNNLNPAGAGYDAVSHDFTAGGIQGSDGGGTNSDSLTLRGAVGTGIGIYGKMNNKAATLKVDKGSGLKAGDIVLLSDCESGDIFQVTNINTSGTNKDQVNHNTGNPKDDNGNTIAPGNYNPGACTGMNAHCLSKDYDEDAQIYQPRTVRYSVALSGGIPNLMRNGQPLLEGVENLQVLYGIDTDGDGAANQYKAAASGLAWDDVVSVRYVVLVRSVEAALTTAESQTHDLLGTSIDTDDRFLRAVFTDTVTIRNRAP